MYISCTQILNYIRCRYVYLLHAEDILIEFLLKINNYATLDNACKYVYTIVKSLHKKYKY